MGYTYTIEDQIRDVRQDLADAERNRAEAWNHLEEARQEAGRCERAVVHQRNRLNALLAETLAGGEVAPREDVSAGGEEAA